MANASVLPFGGAQSLEVAYGAGINLISNMHTAGRMEAFTRNLLFPTATATVNGLAASGTTLEPCTASRQLSEVKHVPAAPGIEPGASAFSLPRWWPSWESNP